MKIIDGFEQNTPEWLEARKGKITGTKLGDIVTAKPSSPRKVGFYQLIADRLGIDPDGEDAMERGHRLEDEAIEEFKKDTKLEIERVGLCVREDNENIAVSPDALIKNKKGKYIEALEVKCLGSARHIEAIIENKLPKDYKWQAMQYFIVIDELEKLHFVLYDPRITCKPYHRIEVKREDFGNDIENYLVYQMATLREIDEYVEKLSF